MPNISKTVPSASNLYTIVAAVTGKKIAVTRLICLCGSTATDLTFYSKVGTTATAITPTLANGANGGAVLPDAGPAGWFETEAGGELCATTTSGSATAILGHYTIKD